MVVFLKEKSNVKQIRAKTPYKGCAAAAMKQKILYIFFQQWHSMTINEKCFKSAKCNLENVTMPF